MSQLIQIRQHIRAIETIKKITHAMRLIAMSAHATLKQKQSSASFYVESLKDILAHLGSTKAPSEQSSLATLKKLVIVIGSQKGLCGNFNTNLLYYFQNSIASEELQNTSFVLIGNRIIDSVKRYPITILDTIPTLSLKTVPAIVKKIEELIPQFDTISCISNSMKSFFIQEPQTTIIDPHHHEPTSTLDMQDYLWEIPADTMRTALIPHYYEAAISSILLQSLLAEQAARFIAMDSATRNARNLLDEKKLEYNKLRQALITKELSELSGIFSA